MSITDSFKSTPESTIKNLVEILHDGQAGFRQASENVKDVQLKELFNRFSLQRSKFAGELQSELTSMGEKDAQNIGSTASGTVHRGWIDLKSAFTNNDNHAVLSEAERGEDVAKKAYKDALEDHHLPATLRALISQQAAEIQMAHDEIKALRDAAKKS